MYAIRSYYGQLSGGALLGVFYIGLLSTVLGYLFWLQGIQALGAPKASLYRNNFV